MTKVQAASLYAGGHLTRQARAMLARLYLEAEAGNSLDAKIERHRQRRPRKQRPLADQQQQQHEGGSVPAGPCLSGRPAPAKGAPPAPVTDPAHTTGDFEQKLKDDTKREQWGDRLRKTAPQDVSKARERDSLNWASIISFEQKQFEKSVQEQHAQSEARKEQYRRDLLHQMNLHEQARRQHEEDMKKEMLAKQREHGLFVEQDRAIQAARRQKMEELKQSRMSQISGCVEARKTKQALEREAAERAREDLLRRLNAEKVENALKKQRHRAQQWEVIVENNRERQRKMETAAQEVAENRELQRRYAEMLDRQDAERQRMIDDRHTKQETKSTLFQAVIDERNAQVKIEDERIARAQQQIAKEQEEREQAEAAKRQASIDRDHAILLAQIQERAERRATAKQVRIVP